MFIVLLNYSSSLLLLFLCWYHAGHQLPTVPQVLRIHTCTVLQRELLGGTCSCNYLRSVGKCIHEWTTALTAIGTSSMGSFWMHTQLGSSSLPGAAHDNVPTDADQPLPLSTP